MHRNLLAVVAAAALVATAGPGNAYPRPTVTYRVSVTSSGRQGNGGSGIENYEARGVSMTPDGRYVAFASLASNLVPGDVNKMSDVFVHDRRTGRTDIVSVDSRGNRGKRLVAPFSSCSEGSNAPVISANGRYVAFDSCFGNLSPGCDATVSSPPKTECLDAPRIFVHDRVTHATTLVSVPAAGLPAGGYYYPSISADGRYVAFEYSTLDLGDACDVDPVQHLLCQQTGVGRQVYVRDRQRGTTMLASVNSAGVPANGGSRDVSISPDGRYVAFVSAADNLASGDANQCPTASPPALPSCPDVFLHDFKTKQTELVSVGLDGSSGNDSSGYFDKQRVAISAGGRYVLFNSRATNLVPNGAGVVFASFDEYVRDRSTGRTMRVSVDSAGQTNVSPGLKASISADGRYTAFTSTSGLAVHDLLTGATDFMPASGAIGGASFPRIGAGGRYLGFSSQVTNLVAGDTNEAWDVFVLDRGDALGVGGLARAGKLSVAGVPSFSATGLVSAAGRSSAGVMTDGADLRRASLAYRPSYGDLFVRLEVERMPLFAAASPALVYGLRLAAGGVPYEVRVVKGGADALAGSGASFGLFRLGAAGWSKVATLRGGYGMTGQEVVVALPLASVGLARGGRLSEVSAFTAIGDYVAGAIQPLDSIALTPN